MQDITKRHQAISCSKSLQWEVDKCWIFFFFFLRIMLQAVVGAITPKLNEYDQHVT